MQRGNFREDLYHRINEFMLQVPRLSDRQADLMLFANHFLHQANKELNRNVQRFDDRVVTIFRSYSWPGNIREIRNVIRRSVLLSKGEAVTSDTLPQEMISTSGNNLITHIYNGDDLKETIDKIEFEKIKAVLEKVKYNKTKAAQLLNIDRKTLYNKLKQFNIDV